MKTYTLTLTEAQLLRLVDFLLRDSAEANAGLTEALDLAKAGREQWADRTERSMKRASQFVAAIKPSGRKSADRKIDRETAIQLTRQRSLTEEADALEHWRNRSDNTGGWDRWFKMAHPNAAGFLWPKWGESQVNKERRAG